MLTPCLTRALLRTRRSLLACALAASLLPADAGNVDTEILILIDTQTYSKGDFDLMLESVAKSFEQPDFYTTAMRGLHGAISSSVMFYNMPEGGRVALSWTELTSQQDFLNFAGSVRSLAYPETWGNISYASALTAATSHFNASPSTGTLQQITILDDGTGFWEAEPAQTRAARDAAVASGVDVINAVVFDAAWREDAVRNYYNANIVSPEGALIVVSSPQGGDKPAGDIALISESIHASISGPTIAAANALPPPPPSGGTPHAAIPEPGTAGLLALGFTLAAIRRRR